MYGKLFAKFVCSVSWFKHSLTIQYNMFYREHVFTVIVMSVVHLQFYWPAVSFISMKYILFC